MYACVVTVPCVTWPFCHNADRHHVQYVTMPRCTILYMSQYRYAPFCTCHNTDMHHSPYVAIPICTILYMSQYRYAPFSICHNTDMHHSLFHNAEVYHSLYVKMPGCTILYMSQGRDVPCSISHKRDPYVSHGPLGHVPSMHKGSQPKPYKPNHMTWHVGPFDVLNLVILRAWCTERYCDTKNPMHRALPCA